MKINVIIFVKKRVFDMKIKCIPVGYLQANCYILEKNNKAILIDPGDNEVLISEKLGELELVGILITHNHFDHVGALSYFEDKYNLKHNEKVEGWNYEVIETKGHSKDSVSFYFSQDNVLFTGDFIFKGSIGRMDLPGGDEVDMKNSLEKINDFDDNIIVYPGHGVKTILHEEKKLFKYYF